MAARVMSRSSATRPRISLENAPLEPAAPGPSPLLGNLRRGGAGSARYRCHHPEMVAREDAVHRLVEADARLERLAAIAIVGPADEDVVDAPIGFLDLRRERVPPRESDARRAVSDDAETICEVHALAAEPREAAHEANLVRV